MARSSFVFSALLLSGLLLSGGCDPQITQPTLADLSATLRAYEAPSGVLTADNVEAAVAAAAPRLRQLQEANPEQLLLGLVSELEPELESRGVITADGGRSEAVLRIDAAIRLRFACPGPNPDAPQQDGRFGRMVLESRIDANVLASVIQGSAHACVFSAASATRDAATLDGALFLNLYARPTEDLRELGLLWVLDGSLTSSVDPEHPLRNFDARTRGALLESRLDVAGAEVIAFTEGTTFGIRDARARYTCDVDARTCSAPDGTTLPW